MKKKYLLLCMASAFLYAHYGAQAQCPTNVHVTQVSCGYGDKKFKIMYRNSSSQNEGLKIECNCFNDCIKLKPTTGDTIYTSCFSACSNNFTIKLYAHYNNGNCTGYCSSLPVDLVSFEAERKGKTAFLTWTTASERNNKGFRIERSLNGNLWDSVGFVGSKASTGTSDDLLSYQYTDQNTEKAVTYYRLNQIDIDLNQHPSVDRLIPGKEGGVIFPNPVKRYEMLRIVFDNSNTIYNVALFSIEGKALKNWRSQSNVLELQVGELSVAPGIYILEIVDNKAHVRKTEKIVVE